MPTLLLPWLESPSVWQERKAGEKTLRAALRSVLQPQRRKKWGCYPLTCVPAETEREGSGYASMDEEKSRGKERERGVVPSDRGVMHQLLKRKGARTRGLWCKWCFWNVWSESCKCQEKAPFKYQRNVPLGPRTFVIFRQSSPLALRWNFRLGNFN